MAQKYYVMLTGGKNNAGDYLIKHRARSLLSTLRPDRELIDMDGWKLLDNRSLEKINGAQALILMGGPALQKRMRPRVYALTENLKDISTPIVTMGIGWYSPVGAWENTHNYPLNKPTIELLEKINSGTHASSVRDYHTLNVLSARGFNNFLMTGCPAMYSTEHLDVAVDLTSNPRTVAFSLGVSLKFSRRMREQMKNVILHTRERFPHSKFEVVFHHGLGSSYLQTHRASRTLHREQNRLAEWLNSRNISYADVSGSAEALIDYYSSCSLHIGYRLHAHIFMSSISKPSMLLIEDGRGHAIRDVLGGVNAVAYRAVRAGKFPTLLERAGIPFDKMVPQKHFIDDYSNLLDYEMSSGVRFGQTSESIKRHFPVMRKFLSGLP